MQYYYNPLLQMSKRLMQCFLNLQLQLLMQRTLYLDNRLKL